MKRFDRENSLFCANVSTELAGVALTVLVMDALREAFFLKTDLSGAYLQWTNLQGARELELSQLVQVAYLRGATLPDGSRYDGRLNLAGDLKWARTSEKIAFFVLHVGEYSHMHATQRDSLG